MTHPSFSASMIVLALTACRGDAPKKEPPREPPPAPAPPTPVAADAAKPNVSDLACDAIFPAAERDKVAPKAYESPGSAPGHCKFVAAVKGMDTPPFYIHARCERTFADDAAMQNEAEKRAAGRPKQAVAKVGKRAFFSEGWAIGWDDDSPCVVEVSYVPEPFDPVAVLSFVLHHISEKK